MNCDADEYIFKANMFGMLCTIVNMKFKIQ